MIAKHIKIRQLLYTLLAITAISCSSDDAEDNVPVDPADQLILRRISREGSDFSSNFNTSGRLKFSIVNENSINEVKIEHFFNDLNQRIRTLDQRNERTETTEYEYDNLGRIVEIKKTTDDIFSEAIIVTNFTYMNNKIIGTNTVSQEDFEFVYTFTDDSYDELTSFKASNLSASEVFFEENYSYDANGNFEKTTIVTSVSEQIDAVLMTYEYDDKINPWAATNRMDYLNELLISADKRTGTLVPTLVLFSKNNRKTSFIIDHMITLEYNEEGYIIKETDGPTIPDELISDSVLLFEYY